MTKAELKLMEKDQDLIYKPEKLRLLCRKCGNEWKEIRPKGYLVRCENNNTFLVDRRRPQVKKLFKCPSCGARKNMGRMTPQNKKVNERKKSREIEEADDERNTNA